MRRVKLEIVGPIAMLICGILAVVGLFLPWISSTGYLFGAGGSGWDYFRLRLTNGSLWMLVGGILMIVCAIAIFVLPRILKKSEYKVRALGIVAASAVLLVMFSALWMFSMWDFNPGVDSTDHIRYGFYFTVTAATLGLIAAIVMSLATFQPFKAIHEGESGLNLKARVAESLVILAFGVVGLVGLFLPWIYYEMNDGSYSIWWIIDSLPYMEINVSMPQPYLVLAGGITMVVLALLIFAISLYFKGSRRISIISGIGISIAALLSIAGASWFIVGPPQILRELGDLSIDCGVYLSLAAAVLALVFGIMLSTNGWPKALNKLYGLRKRREQVKLS